MNSSIVPQSTPDGNFQIFEFLDMKLRAKKLSDGRPVFVAIDACRALGLTNVSKALQHIPEEEKAITDGYTPSGMQSLLCVTEPGLYRLIFRSNRPEAEKFRKWVFEDVLPQLRETGSYAVEPLTPAELNLRNAQLLVDHERQLAELQSGQKELDSRVTHIEVNLNTDEMYYTLKAWFIHIKQPCPPRQELAQLGKRATKLSTDLGYKVSNVPDATFEHVNIYHQDILKQVVR